MTVNWRTYRKKTTIKAILIEECRDGDELGLPGFMRRIDSMGGEFSFRTREGETDWLHVPYYVATDGKDYWPVAPDFMEANYEEVQP